ncbi:hypothetical protein HMPREF9296_2503 [Prevotella disiens FB035-09AN]|uniref:Uncharacterized protein n=1 Tax=Prevotella disiens FB035-09AN TaxID=866771 RepID=E1KNW7_9BACT|nr:hypothetical protein [Prevotella disiens]EFL46855.1 hypothetical protein HMPREF9296_2503 [Prevotella disiens FB035-09AN]
MKPTHLARLSDEAATTLYAFLEADYTAERIENIQAIEDYLMDQWRDNNTINPDLALRFLDTLRVLRKDLKAFLPTEEA